MKTGRTAAVLCKDLKWLQAEGKVQGLLRARRTREQTEMPIPGDASGGRRRRGMGRRRTRPDWPLETLW